MQRSYGEKVEIKEKDYDEEWTKSAYQAKEDDQCHYRSYSCAEFINILK